MTFLTVASPGRIVWAWLLLAAASLLALGTPATAAPGEDPLVLNSRVEYLNMPWAAAAPSRGLETVSEMPVAIQAKVSRYLAKSMSGNTDGIQTDKDVITTTATQGLRRSCTQEIASNTATGKNGTINSAPQIVVLRGDLINACR
jgi:hypothetical protein